MARRNRYISVVVNGNLCAWTGRNADKFPEDKKVALTLARNYRELGQTAYAVEIIEILDTDTNS